MAKVAVVVHGRFHAFDLARELAAAGHDVTLLTNYPKSQAERFGIPRGKVRSFLAHGILSRIAFRLPGRFHGSVERRFNLSFGRWAAGQLAREDWDVVIGWSGVSEESFRRLPAPCLKILTRGSAHIRSQHRLLHDEELRAGCRIDKPSEWIVEREEREYQLADRIQIPSGFVLQTFLEQGVPEEKLLLIPRGVSMRQFRPPETVHEERRRRILAGEPVRVLNVGSFSFRKGALDLAAVIEELDGQNIRFRFVGPVAKEAELVAQRLAGCAEFIPKRPQAELPQEYAWGDLFLLPTIEDGAPMVLFQALAAGLPVLASPNCAAPDVIREGRTGWICPIRRPDLLAERLRWSMTHRQELAQMAEETYRRAGNPDWQDVGCLLSRKLEGILANRTPAVVPN